MKNEPKRRDGRTKADPPAESWWRAILRRDPKFEKAFVYGVRTTGVYCRSSCRSRIPLRENVVFFKDAVEADRAGFRACRRCRPADANAYDPRLRKAIQKACELIENSEEAAGMNVLAAKAGLSPGRFRRDFKAATGVTPKQYAMALRAERARRMIRGGTPIGDAVYLAGFGASSRFYETAASHLGMPPRTFRSGGAGEIIFVAVTKTPLGFLLVAATQRGVCEIAVGDSRRELMDECRARFAKATIQPAAGEFSKWVRKIVASIENPRRKLDLPLDIQGTAFQRRVWQELQRIPPGATTTYQALATKVGRPRAVRAAASACAANPVALAIPCHRAVRSDGGLGGYRWGIERKRKLLDSEKKIGPTSAQAIKPNKPRRNP